MRFGALLAVSLLCVGCKGKPQRREAPPNAEVAGSNSTKHEDIHLPRGDGSPPKKTQGPLSPEVIKKLRALQFPRFESENHGSDKSVVIAYRTDDRPKIKATIQIRPCESSCVPLELDRWKTREELKEFLPVELRGAPGTVFEVGSTDLNAVPMIYTYQVGLAEKEGASYYTDTYVLYFNDGVNEIRVVASYVDNRPDTLEILQKKASKQDLENVAKGFLDVFTQNWV